MPHSLARVALAPDEDGVGALRRAQSELVEGEALAASSRDPRTRRLGETESANGELRGLEKAGVVRHSADKDGNLVLLALHQVRQARQRQRRVVDARHEQALQDDLVEGRVGSPGEEAVKLHQEEEVDILGLRGRPVALLLVLVLDVDTLSSEQDVSHFSPRSASPERRRAIQR